MRHFFYDDSADKATIDFLKVQLSVAKEHAEFLKSIVTNLDRRNEELQLKMLETVKAPAPAPISPSPTITTEELARSLGLPVSAVDEIDFERLGIQLQATKGRR